MMLSRHIRIGVFLAGFGVLSLVAWRWELWLEPVRLANSFWHNHCSVPVDYFQGWASARNYYDGMPIYSLQKESYVRYFADLGFDPAPASFEPPDINTINAHPPTSVLLFLPLAHGLTYVASFRLWNVLSIFLLAATLWLVVTQLRVRLPLWGWGLVAIGLLVCYPLRCQLHHAQLNTVLMLLITGAWAAGRNNRPVMTGILLGAASVIKLFPALLFLYFLLRGQWRVLGAGAACALALTALTIGVLGAETYKDYVGTVLPILADVQSWCGNTSVIGFWKKLFDSSGAGYLPVESPMRAPFLAQVGILVSGALLLAIFIRAVVRSRESFGYDLLFGMAVVVMLLLSPITWQHGYLLLCLPLAILWRRLPALGFDRLFSYVCAAVLWVNPGHWLYGFHGSEGQWVPPTGVYLFTTVSFQLYALLGLFVLFVLEAEKRTAPQASALKHAPARLPEGVGA
jgi:hypothetical protein